jgi:hypothetical protein
LNGTNLKNKLNVWKSDDCWALNPLRGRKGNQFYIENTSKDQVLGLVDDNVELVQDGRGHAWEKGEPNKQGYFTLTNLASQKALSAVSEDCLTVEGNAYSKLNFLNFLSDTSHDLYQQIKTHMVSGDCLNL